MQETTKIERPIFFSLITYCIAYTFEIPSQKVLDEAKTETDKMKKSTNEVGNRLMRLRSYKIR